MDRSVRRHCSDRPLALPAPRDPLPVGALCARYTKIFFGMLTLAFGMLFHSFLFKFYDITGGDQGMRVPRPTIAGNAFRPGDIFKTRAERVCFVKGDPDLEYQEVAKVIDVAKGVGIDQVGLMTKKVEAGE